MSESLDNRSGTDAGDAGPSSPIRTCVCQAVPGPGRVRGPGAIKTISAASSLTSGKAPGESARRWTAVVARLAEDGTIRMVRHVRSSGIGQHVPVSRAVWVMVDVEATGPVPGLYSMTEVGAIVVEPGLSRTFYGRLRPLEGSEVDPDAIAVTGRKADELASWPAPEDTMAAFDRWLRSLGGRPLGVSDNNGFDFAFVNWYFWRFCGSSPFGHSSTNLGSLYKGLVSNTRKNFKHLRDTPHTHNPLDDARGNAEAMLKLAAEYGLDLE